jgi:hypothetical protein
MHGFAPERTSDVQLQAPLHKLQIAWQADKVRRSWTYAAVKDS